MFNRRIPLLLLIAVMAVLGSAAATSASNHSQGMAGDAVPDSYIITLVDGASVDDVGRRAWHQQRPRIQQRF